jgi:hypothetical protein
MIRVYCDRHATRIGADALSLKCKAGSLPDGRVCLDLCPECAAEFLTWLGDRAAVLPPAIAPAVPTNGVATAAVH